MHCRKVKQKKSKSKTHWRKVKQNKVKKSKPTMHWGKVKQNKEEKSKPDMHSDMIFVKYFTPAQFPKF